MVVLLLLVVLVQVRESSVADLSCTDYLQTYIVLKPPQQDQGGRPEAAQQALRDVMFRFGSWCYSGKVQVGGGQAGNSSIQHRGGGGSDACRLPACLAVLACVVWCVVS